MKIAQIAPLSEAVPPQLYGGTERVVAHLCNALVELGHDVTLFATADADTRAQLVPVRDQATRLDRAPRVSELAAHLMLLDEVQRRADEFDVLHFHVDMLHFPLFEARAAQTVTTLHGRLDVKDLAPLYRRYDGFGLVSVSNNQREPLPDARWLATIPHGLPLDYYAFTERPAEDYLVFLGRMSPEKRPTLAIDLARTARVPLKMAAKVDENDLAYFETDVKPKLEASWVDFVGEIDDAHKAAFLGNARALLFPVDWPEPFGLVMIEAMACGTPVIAWDCGSVPEIVDDGVTGFIVTSEKQALAAIARVADLDRRCIRATFERRFGAPTMARAYVDVYERLVSAKRRATSDNR